MTHGGGRRGARRGRRDDLHDRRHRDGRAHGGRPARRPEAQVPRGREPLPDVLPLRRLPAAKVAFSGPYPGKIIRMPLQNSAMLCQRDSFLCAAGTDRHQHRVHQAARRRVLRRRRVHPASASRAPATCFIHSGGTIMPIELKAGREAAGRHRLPRRVRSDGRLRHRVRRRDQDGAVRRGRAVLRVADRTRPRLGADAAVLAPRRSDHARVPRRQGRSAPRRLRRRARRARRPDRRRLADRIHRRSGGWHAVGCCMTFAASRR